MITKRVTLNWFGWQLSVQLMFFVFICCTVTICLMLSHWQWQRAQDAEQRYQTYLSRTQQAPVALTANVKDYQRVETRGSIERLLLLDNQIRDGVVGWYVLAVLKTEQFPVLINLGWQAATDKTPTLDLLPKDISVSGWVKQPEVGLMLAPAEKDPAWPGILQQIDIPLLNSHLNMQLAPFVIYINERLAGPTPVSVAPENKYPMHIGYTVQWLLIAIAFVIGFIFACRQESVQ